LRIVYMNLGLALVLMLAGCVCGAERREEAALKARLSIPTAAGLGEAGEERKREMTGLLQHVSLPAWQGSGQKHLALWTAERLAAAEGRRNE
jgi:hypothetical protein